MCFVKYERNLWYCIMADSNIQVVSLRYKNTKVKDRSPHGDTDYFDIVAGGLQRDTFALFLFIICLGYGLRTSIYLIEENIFKPAKERSRRYPQKLL